VARNQNSIRLDGEKKTLGEPRLSRGPVLLWLEEKQFIKTIRSLRLELNEIRLHGVVTMPFTRDSITIRKSLESRTLLVIL